MLFIPVRQKYKKQQKGKAFNKIVSVRSNLIYGQLGLKILSSYRLNSKQLLAIYNGIRKKIKRKGKLIVNIFPQTPITKKPVEVRMGKGKGNVNSWVCKIKAGVILFEISTPYKTFAKKVLTNIRYRLPFKSTIVISN